MSTALSPRDGPAVDPRERLNAEPAIDDDGDAEGLGAQNQFVTFALAGEMFAVPMAPVQEIIRMPEVAHLPLAPRALDGLANLRGRVLPIVNLRRLLGCEDRANDDATRALVIHIGQPLGFVVDRVASVVTIEPGEIESAAAIQTIVNADYLSGVIKRPRPEGGHDMLLAIDFARLIEGQFGGVGRGSHGSAARADSTDALAPAPDEDGPAGDELRLVSFSVADQEYALDIAEVQEIVQLPERISLLPNAPAHVLGLISLRQRLLPLVSLRALFGLPPLAHAEQHRIVVTSLPGGLSVGLVTDAVKEVLSVPRAQVEPLPGVLATDQQLDEFSAICRLDGGQRLVSILATDKLLRMPAIAQALDATRAAAQGDDVVNPAQQRQPLAGDEMADDVADGDDDAQVVVFRLGDEEFGVPIMSVQEIVRVPETLTRVPRTPAFVEGVINLRGTVLPVIDQRGRLGLPLIERNDRQRIMVYLIGGLRTGFIVDSVAEVLRIPRAAIVPAPTMGDTATQLISRIANLEGARRMVMLIEPGHLLQGGEVQAIGQLADPAPALPVLARAA